MSWSAARRAVLRAALLAGVGCGGGSDERAVRLQVVMGASMTTRPAHLEGQWLDGRRGLLRFRVPRDGELRGSGPELATVRMSVAEVEGARRVVIVGRAAGQGEGGAPVGEGTAVVDLSLGPRQDVTVTLEAARAPDRDGDGVPDAIDVCPGDDFAGCEADAAAPPDGGPDAALAPDADPPDGGDAADLAAPDTRVPDGRTDDGGDARVTPPDAPAPDTLAVTPPVLAPVLAGRLVSGAQVDLSWMDGNSDETGFVVERAVGAGAFAKLRELPANAVSASDTMVLPLRRYRYRVAATNAGGSGPPSNVVEVDAPAVKLQGIGFGTRGVTAESDFRKAMDGDVMTFFLGPTSERDIANGGFRVDGRHVVTRIRFHPRRGFTGDMVGGQFQGSLQSSIAGFEAIATITAAPAEGWNEIVLPAPSKPYIWLRYWTAPGASANVAEFEFWGGPE